MKRNDFEKLCAGILKSSLSAREKKGSAYAKGDDILAAFRRDAAIAEILELRSDRPEHRALMEIVKKVSRLASIENKFDTENHLSEIRDSIVDIVNFTLLYAGFYFSQDPE
jgi:hypothetical protein